MLKSCELPSRQKVHTVQADAAHRKYSDCRIEAVCGYVAVMPHARQHASIQPQENAFSILVLILMPSSCKVLARQLQRYAAACMQPQSQHSSRMHLECRVPKLRPFFRVVAGDKGGEIQLLAGDRGSSLVFLNGGSCMHASELRQLHMHSKLARPLIPVLDNARSTHR